MSENAYRFSEYWRYELSKSQYTLIRKIDIQFWGNPIISSKYLNTINIQIGLKNFIKIFQKIIWI